MRAPVLAAYPAPRDAATGALPFRRSRAPPAHVDLLLESARRDATRVFPVSPWPHEKMLTPPPSARCAHRWLLGARRPRDGRLAVSAASSQVGRNCRRGEVRARHIPAPHPAGQLPGGPHLSSFAALNDSWRWRRVVEKDDPDRLRPVQSEQLRTPRPLSSTSIPEPRRPQPRVRKSERAHAASASAPAAA